MVLLILTDVRIVYTFSWKYTIILSSLCLYLFGLRVPSDSKSGSSSEKYSKGTHVRAYVKNLFRTPAFQKFWPTLHMIMCLEKNFNGREGWGGSGLSRTPCILRFILPCKSECQPIFQNSIQIFQIKFLVSRPKFSKAYSPSVFYIDGLKLYVFESLKWKYKF